jgi:hypothetical protein
MNKKILKAILAANLIMITVLVFIYPQLMVAPGKLIPGHTQINTDCFACHAPLSGVLSERCITCHKPADIGRLLTTGQAITKPKTSTPFHQALNSQDCVACHSDHAGVMRFMKKSHFNHALLQKTTSEQCQNCHKPPTDSLHQQITSHCAQCHTQEQWKATTFDHTQYFSLTGDHNTRCVTCHERNDFSHYTCYGCHEHSPENIRRKHIEEGINNFDNCVECHRSASEHEISERGGKRNSEKEDD